MGKKMEIQMAKKYMKKIKNTDPGIKQPSLNLTVGFGLGSELCLCLGAQLWSG